MAATSWTRPLLHLKQVLSTRIGRGLVWSSTLHLQNFQVVVRPGQETLYIMNVQNHKTAMEVVPKVVVIQDISNTTTNTKVIMHKLLHSPFPFHITISLHVTFKLFTTT